MKSNCGSSCTDLASNEAGNWKWLQGQEHEEPHRSLSIFLFPSSLYISVLCSVYLSCCYVHLKHANTSMYSLSQGERTLIPELRFIALFVLCRHFPLSTTPKGISKKKSFFGMFVVSVNFPNARQSTIPTGLFSSFICSFFQPYLSSTQTIQA